MWGLFGMQQLFTLGNKAQRMASAFTFFRVMLQRRWWISHLHCISNKWLIFVSFVNVETKQRSNQWIHTYSPNKLKMLKQTLSARKLIAAVFWDRKGVLTTCDQNSAVRCIFQNTKKRAVHKKGHRVLTSSVVLLHVNIHLHTYAHTRALLEHFNCGLLDHPPYSPHLALSSCNLFTYLMNWLWSQRFGSNEEMMEGSRHGWAHRQHTSLTQAYKNFPCYNKCLNFGGDYVEKLIKCVHSFCIEYAHTQSTSQCSRH
jgi:hypothetical protein